MQFLYENTQFGVHLQMNEVKNRFRALIIPRLSLFLMFNHWVLKDYDYLGT